MVLIIVKLIIPVTSTTQRTVVLGIKMFLSGLSSRSYFHVFQKNWQNVAKTYTKCQFEKLLSKDWIHG